MITTKLALVRGALPGGGQKHAFRGYQWAFRPVLPVEYAATIGLNRVRIGYSVPAAVSLMAGEQRLTESDTGSRMPGAAREVTDPRRGRLAVQAWRVRSASLVDGFWRMPCTFFDPCKGKY